MSGSVLITSMSFSPEMKEAGLSSCFGRLDEKESRYVFRLLLVVWDHVCALGARGLHGQGHSRRNVSGVWDGTDLSRKVHYLLVQTLNAAFPEHDFAALQPEHFTREPNAAVVLEQMSGRLLYKTTALPYACFLSLVINE